MNVLRKQLWGNCLTLVLVTVLLASCFQQTEETLQGYSNDLVSVLNLDIVEESHNVIIALIHADAPASYITSEYVVSNPPKEIRERLKMLHLSQEGWLAPGEDGWIGGVPIEPNPPSPAKVEEFLRYLLVDSSKDVNRGINSESLPRIEFFLICPWNSRHNPDGGFEYYLVSSDSADVVILGEDGKFVSRIHNTSNWPRRCLNQDR